MKVYVLKDSDFEELLAKLKLEKLDPSHDWGTEQDLKNPKYLRESIHRAFHYVACRWMDGVKK